MQHYQLCYGTPNARRPAYFNSEIDALFLREDEHTDVCYSTEAQAQYFLRELPDKHEIQRLNLSPKTARFRTPGAYFSPGWGPRLPPAMILLFPNLKEVTFVKGVRSDRQCSCGWYHYRQGRRSYWLRQASNSLSTASGFTHFIEEDEIRHLEPTFHQHYHRFANFSFNDQRMSDQSQMEELIQLQNAGHWGDVIWNTPTFQYKGVSYDRIATEKMFCSTTGVLR
jgi:hypothetical protein